MLVQKAAPAEEEGVDTDSDSGDKEIILTIMKKGGLRIGCRSENYQSYSLFKPPQRFPNSQTQRERKEGEKKKDDEKKKRYMHSLLRHKLAIKMVLVFFDDISKIGI